MSNWMLYDEFVDLVRRYHHNRYSGLITGVSENQHSFQIGFESGEVVALSYCIKKGAAALELISQIERAKIAEHPIADIPGAGAGVPDTSTVLSQLTFSSHDDTSQNYIPVSQEIPVPPKASENTAAGPLDSRLIQIIEAAAVHHFGPIGAVVCEEHLANPNGDLNSIIHKSKSFKYCLILKTITRFQKNIHHHITS